MNILKLDKDLHGTLWGHLLPKDTKHEQAAFLFCTTSESNGGIRFNVVEHALLQTSDFAVQERDCIELNDEARIGLIKRAHTLETSLVELHSHPHSWSAAFSISDRKGLRKTVPHMHWRLKKRPYLAIVVAPFGFDALVWPNNAVTPEELAGIEVEGELLKPTNISLEDWDNE